MIHSVLDLQSKTVEQVMVPLVDIVAIERGTRVDDFFQTVNDSGFSRIPVFETRVDNITGIVNLLDVIYTDGETDTIDRYVRTDVQVVPESKNIGDLLREIQRSTYTMVFVVDEYGGIVGLVTVEDLVEEIVGEFSDERDTTRLVRRIGPRLLECDGRTEVQMLRDEFGVPIPTGDYETIAGYVLDQRGSIPKAGESVASERFVVTISASDARVIRTVRIRIVPPASSDLEELREV